MNGRIRNQGSLEAFHFLQSFHHLIHIQTLSAFGLEGAYDWILAQLEFREESKTMEATKNKAIKACFFARVCLLISSRAIYERCLWLLHTSSWATADGGNRKQTWARQETFVSGERSGGCT